MDNLTHELHNSIQYSIAAFEGDEKSMSFPALVTYYEKGKQQRDLLKITYAYASKKITRSTELLREKKKKGIKTPLLTDTLQKLSFSYGFYNKDEESVEWNNAWDPEEHGVLPRIVKVTLVARYYDKERKKIEDKQLERKIFIPHGAWGQESA